ncbi:MAG TPA: PKD domain-containing protein [Candidatus Thermoplasmatota archaeon]|nr:PKD domain-containing protein [Candidatus Thermoplasmatota archaeon]
MRALLACSLAILLAGCVQIQVGSAPPSEAEATPGAEATFTWTPKEPRAGQVVSFTAHVTSVTAGDSVKAARWSFGDGGAETGMTAMHVFKAGRFGVRLTVDTALSGRLTSTQAVAVSGTAGAARPTGGSITPIKDLPPYEPSTITAEVDLNVVRFGFDLDEGGPELEQVDAAHWSFGDGSNSTLFYPEHRYYDLGEFPVTLRLLTPRGPLVASTMVRILEVPFQPHVLVGVPDSGINPYHDQYSRPELTAHPCTYIRDYPCSVPSLNLSLDEPDFAGAFAKDKALWQSIRPGDVFWIPRTNIVAALCEDFYFRHPASNPEGAVSTEPEYCILDDYEAHGTHTTSSVLMENPDALIAFKEGGSSIAMFQEAGIPVDLFSVSWGTAVPIPTPGVGPLSEGRWRPFVVKAAGNDPRPGLSDSGNGQSHVLYIGGGGPGLVSDREGEMLAATVPEAVSYFCRGFAGTQTVTEMASGCGTSYATPTVAGGLSKALLGVRRASGYDGSGMDSGWADEVAGLSVGAFRDAFNRTASYEPTYEYPEAEASTLLGAPVNPAAPWLQWGWGFYDGAVADTTLAYLLGAATPDKSAEAKQFMAAQYEVRKAYYG